MAVRTRDEILGSMKTVLGDNASDDALSLIEDFTDTMTDMESRLGEDWKAKYDENNASWEKKYKDNDTAWRTKYRERFFGGGDPSNGITTPGAVVQDNADDLQRESEVKSFSELFKEKEDRSGY